MTLCDVVLNYFLHLPRTNSRALEGLKTTPLLRARMPKLCIFFIIFLYFINY